MADDAEHSTSKSDIAAVDGPSAAAAAAAVKSKLDKKKKVAKAEGEESESEAESDAESGAETDGSDDEEEHEEHKVGEVAPDAHLAGHRAATIEKTFPGLYTDPSDPTNFTRITVYGPPHPPADFTYQLKIVLGFLQIVTNIGTGLDIQWPSTFTNFILSIDVLNFNALLTNVSSIDCVSEVTYYIKFLFIVCSPVAIFFLLFIFYLLPRRMRWCCHRFMLEEAALRSTINFWRMFVYTLFLIYPGLSSTVLRHYVCKSIDGNDFLYADFRVRCYTAIWYAIN
jgi:hypothetical protein